MAKAKRKTLPKDFEALLKEGDIEKLKAALEACEPNASGSYDKRPALAYACPDEITRWLVARGAAVDGEDRFGRTPLDHRITYGGNVEILLDLGADVNHAARLGETPLHRAADCKRARYVSLLLDRGARIDAKGHSGTTPGGGTPLEYALERCNNSSLPEMLDTARVLVERGAQRSPSTKEYVQQLGQQFEFHRAAFNPSRVEEASAALDGLYALFDVMPVPRRVMHDGVSPISVTATSWEDQYQELWKMLIPSSGAANTVQGEVVRIAGRIIDEIGRNGGMNWDRDHRAMARAYVMHLRSGDALSDADIAVASRLLEALPRGNDDLADLRRLAVQWVVQNPEPIGLSAPGYRR